MGGWRLQAGASTIRPIGPNTRSLFALFPGALARGKAMEREGVGGRQGLLHPLSGYLFRCLDTYKEDGRVWKHRLPHLYARKACLYKLVVHSELAALVAPGY